MKATAVPMKTMLIVTIIGVTLFFEKVLIIKHKQVTVSIKILESQKLSINRHPTSMESSTSSPLWKTTRSPLPMISLLINSVYRTK